VVQGADLGAAVFMDCSFGPFVALESVLEFSNFRDCGFSSVKILKSGAKGS
jgi:hypothetical protein